MDARTSETLAALNERFYAENAMSFSRSRQHPWPGWARVLEASGPPRRAFDLACGNMRFQRYLDVAFPQAHIQHYCVDSCEALAHPAENVSFQHLDVVRCVLEGVSLGGQFEAPFCDLSTCFGFMHHVPGFEARVKVLEELASMAGGGGLVAVSFWRFADDPRRRKRAQATTAQALRTLNVKLEEGDYLLGWNDEPGVYRYCHSFTDEEISALLQAACPSAEPKDSFRSDGGTGNMNAYAILRMPS